MVENCVFCRIVAAKIPSYKVYEDDKTVAFLDIRPLSKGHTLVIPKAHVKQIEDLDKDNSTALFNTVWKLTKHIQQATNTKASLIGINNGQESGQEVLHIHVHIIPRSYNDGGGPIQAAMRNRPVVSNGEMQRIAEHIKSGIRTEHI